MTAFAHVMPSLGAEAIHKLGIGHVARRGGTGCAPQQTPLSKAASSRTISVFNSSPISDISLILTKSRSVPDNKGASGAVSSERRRCDMPQVIRQTSIEHQVHRRHSAPSTSPRFERENHIVVAARLSHSNSAIGRVRGRPQASQTAQTQQRRLSPRVQDSVARLTSPRGCFSSSSPDRMSTARADASDQSSEESSTLLLSEDDTKGSASDDIWERPAGFGLAVLGEGDSSLLVPTTPEPKDALTWNAVSSEKIARSRIRFDPMCFESARVRSSSNPISVNLTFDSGTVADISALTVEAITAAYTKKMRSIPTPSRKPATSMGLSLGEFLDSMSSAGTHDSAKFSDMLFAQRRLRCGIKDELSCTRSKHPRKTALV